MVLSADFYIEVTLLAILFATIIYNIVIIIYRKLYQSWSTFSILAACVLLLITRFCNLIFYRLSENKMKPETFELFYAILTDVPYFFVCNVTLVLIWQWWRIANLLTATEQEV